MCLQNHEAIVQCFVVLLICLNHKVLSIPRVNDECKGFCHRFSSWETILFCQCKFKLIDENNSERRVMVRLKRWPMERETCREMEEELVDYSVLYKSQGRCCDLQMNVHQPPATCKSVSQGQDSQMTCVMCTAVPGNLDSHTICQTVDGNTICSILSTNTACVYTKRGMLKTGDKALGILEKNRNVPIRRAVTNCLNEMKKKCNRIDWESVHDMILGGHASVNCIPGGSGRTRTPISIAAKCGKEEIFKLLLGFGVDLTPVDKYGYNVLHRACGGCDVNIVKILVELGLDIEKGSKDDLTPIFPAVRHGCIKAFGYLLDIGANIKHVTKRKRTILHFACLKGNVAMLDHILNLGLDLERADEEGMTPVFFAVLNNNIKAVKYLIVKGCNTDHISHSGFNLLHAVCQSKRASLRMVQLLLSQNVKGVHSKNKYGNTPLSIALKLKKNSVVAFLKLKNDINQLGKMMSLWVR